MAKKKKSQKPDHILSRPVVVLGGVIGFGIITALAFISPLSSAMALTLFAFSVFMYYENSRRLLWENKTTSKISGLKKAQDRLSKDITVTGYALDDAKDEIEALKHSLEAEDKAPEDEQDTMRAVRKEQHKKNKNWLSYASIYPPLRARRKDAPEDNDDERETTPKTYNPLTDYDALSDIVVQELVKKAIREERVDTFLQPITKLPSRVPHAYEVFARIRARPGVYLPANRYVHIANEDDLMPGIDHLLLMQCLKIVEKSDQKTPFFINVTHRTLSNKHYMAHMLQFIAKHRAMAKYLVLEMKQQDFNTLSQPVLEVLRGLGRLGCHFSLDHVEDLDLDIRFLRTLKVRYIKIAARTLFAKARHEQDFAKFNRLKRQLEGNGIGVIAEKVEDEHVLRELLDFDLHYGQGYLLGKPDLQIGYQGNTKRIRRRTADGTGF